MKHLSITALVWFDQSTKVSQSHRVTQVKTRHLRRRGVGAPEIKTQFCPSCTNWPPGPPHSHSLAQWLLPAGVEWKWRRDGCII